VAAAHSMLAKHGVADQTVSAYLGGNAARHFGIE
jgi:hypothetical protein